MSTMLLLLLLKLLLLLLLYQCFSTWFVAIKILCYKKKSFTTVGCFGRPSDCSLILVPNSDRKLWVSPSYTFTGYIEKMKVKIVIKYDKMRFKRPIKRGQILSISFILNLIVDSQFWVVWYLGLQAVIIEWMASQISYQLVKELRKLLRQVIIIIKFILKIYCSLKIKIIQNFIYLHLNNVDLTY